MTSQLKNFYVKVENSATKQKKAKNHAFTRFFLSLFLQIRQFTKNRKFKARL